VQGLSRSSFQPRSMRHTWQGMGMLTASTRNRRAPLTMGLPPPFPQPPPFPNLSQKRGGLVPSSLCRKCILFEFQP